MTIARDYGYYKGVLAGRPMPFAFVDLDALDDNVQQVLRLSADKRVRVASKSIRSVAVLKRIQARDPRFQGLLCFTAREAIYLGHLGFTDLVVGYPTWHPTEIAEIARAAGEGCAITLMIDSIAHVEHIESIARDHGARVSLCIDLDMASDYGSLHFGVWRSAVRSEDQVRELVDRIAGSKHVALDGVMGYEAQIAGLGDDVAGQTLRSAVIRGLKHRSLREVNARRGRLVEAIVSRGLRPRFVNGGGTGSISATCADASVTEVTVGSAFYAPSLFDNYRDFRYRAAAAFAIEIVRQPRPHLFTCLGGGYIASGAAGADRLPQLWLPEGAKLLPAEGAGEVQTPVSYSGAEKLSLGDPVFLRHSKAGELCERFARLLLVADGRVVDEATTYRGDGQCFL